MTSSPFALHHGEALLRLAGTYPTLLEVVLECVQNALDKKAEVIRVDINQKSRSIVVWDDGAGVTQAEFERALTSVCTSIKKEDKLGRFGLGLISPLGKCAQFSFTSTPKSSPHDYREWTFITERLREQREISGIPMRNRSDLWFGSSTKKGVTSLPWRTQVKIEKFTADRFVSRLSIEAVRDGIVEKFGSVMRKSRPMILVSLTNEDGETAVQQVPIKDFDGTKLPETDIRTGVGKAYFRLYLARKTPKGKEGKVQVGEAQNDFRISLRMFVHSLPEGHILEDDVAHALASGIFEGEILTSQARFHANRRGFEANDALIDFCTAINRWYRTIGRSHYENAQETGREERYQDLGLRSLKVLQAMMEEPAGRMLLHAIESFKRGTIGSGHLKMPGTPSDMTTLSVHRPGDREHPNSDSPSERDHPTTEHTGHMPLVAAGPRGQRRISVRSNSLGLQIVHEVMESENLWTLDAQTGTLAFNVRHPLWVQCEEHGDKTVMRFQEYIMLQALGIQSIPEEYRDVVRKTLLDLNAPYVFMLVNADLLAGRTPQRLNKKKTAARPSRRETSSFRTLTL